MMENQTIQGQPSAPGELLEQEKVLSWGDPDNP